MNNEENKVQEKINASKAKGVKVKTDKDWQYMRFKLLYIIIFSFNILVGQVDFKAKASKTTLGVNERLQIDFNMNKDGDNFTAPSFENFKVAGGQVNL